MVSQRRWAAVSVQAPGTCSDWITLPSKETGSPRAGEPTPAGDEDYAIIPANVPPEPSNVAGVEASFVTA